MSLDKLIVIFTGLAGIIFTYWFFLLKKEEVTQANESITITVDGGYTPNTIQVKKGKTTTLNFFRKDPSSCLEEVVLPEFKIKKFLPLNTTVAIPITPKETGTFEIVCGMNMFHGKLLVTS